MKAFVNGFKYDISYVDVNDMERKHILTNKENLGKIIIKIFDNNGFNLTIDKVD